MGRQALDVVSVASVMSLCLTLRVVEDHEAGHVVADLPRGEAVEVGPAVLPSVAVRPLEAGADIGGLHLTERGQCDHEVESVSPQPPHRSQPDTAGEYKGKWDGL